MKFKKLEIRNINSIAEAVVDFENLMPQDQHIFMIWGPSGAGKSTILDAICMALFCKTPRLQSIAEKKENQYVDPEFQFSDRAKGIAINDLRQYLKRGTKEGFCSLQFVGNDSVTYTARTTFSINRNGNLNNIEWSLTSENGVWSKVKEVEQQVITVTGLTYEQFCRTTMLAQGEFTKFMKSDQNAKAEILEKLTDTSVFSEIGRRIYEKYNAQKKHYEQLNSENENITRLNDEQIAEYQAQIGTIQSDNKHLEEELSTLTQKATWIKQLAVFQEDVIRSEKQWQEANSALNSEENQQRKQLIAQWEQTETERNTLLELRKLRQSALEIAQSEKEFQLYYQQLNAGFLFMKEAIAQTEASKKQLQESLDAQAYKSETFANAQSLSEKLKQYAQLGQNIAQNKEKHRQNLFTLTASELTLAQKQTEINQKQTEIDKVGTDLNELKEKAKVFDLTQLTTSQAQQKDRLRDLNEANKSVQTLKNQQNEINGLKVALAEKQQLMETLTVQMQQEQKEYEKAQSELETAQKVYDMAAKSVHDFAKQVRATLQIGDVCPVCGQKVAQLLTNEAAEESILKLKNALEDAKKAVTSARKQLDVTITSLKTEEGNVNSLKSDLQNKTARKKNDLAVLEENCKKLNITVNETIQAQIDQQLADTENVLKETEEKITVSRSLNLEIEKANVSLDNLKKQLEDLRKSYHEIELQAAKLQQDNTALQAHWEGDEKQQAELQTEMSGFLSTTYPNWSENPTQTAQNLTDEAGVYAKSQEKLTKLQESVEKLQREQQQIERNQQQVHSLFDWPAAEKPQAVDYLLEKWADFVPKCTVLSQNATNCHADIAKRESILQVFYSEHPDIQEDTLSRLADTSIDVVAQLREQQTSAQNQVQNAYGQFQKAQESLQKHQESKPVFSEGEDLEQIEAAITSKNQQKTEKLQLIGQIQQVLQSDADNKRKYADTLRELDALRQEARQWERLNNVFGDSTGKTFRKIAQSFILQKLLDNTNYFLGMLSDRYELTGAGRELMILVKDKYLGDAPRPVEMVSGGESFLISIALALGLSNLALQGVSSDYIFIDEGISQLDGSLCDSVVNTLQQLHHIVHCNIGIISHLDVLAEKIPTKILVRPVSHGTSQVTIHNS
jgi:exonuclease SbcC